MLRVILSQNELIVIPSGTMDQHPWLAKGRRKSECAENASELILPVA